MLKLFKGLDADARRLYAVLLCNFTLFGVTLTIIGAAVPQLIRSFQWSYTITGIVIAAGAIGYFSSTFLSGFFVHAVGPKKILITGLILQAASFFFFARFPSPVINLICHFFVGFGQGSSEVVSNYEVIKMEKQGESRLMNFMHAIFCVGAILGPIAVGNFIRSGLRWNLIFPLFGCTLLGMTIIIAIIPFINPDRSDQTKQKMVLRKLFKPLLFIFFLILLLYVGSEVGVTNWISEYFVKVLGSSVSTGAFMVSVLWIGIFSGRFLISIINRLLRQELMLLVLALTCTLFLLLAVLTENIIATAVFAFFTGFGYSGVYPVVMALIGQYFRHGVALGFASTGGGIGSFSFPFIMAILADSIGLRGSFIFCILVNLIMVGLSLLVMKEVKGHGISTVEVEGEKERQ